MNPLESNTTLHLRRFLPVPRARVWEALTTEADLCRWLGPGACYCTQAKCDPRVGGTFHFRMRVVTSGTGEHREPSIRGTYLEVREPERLVFTWRWADDPEFDSEETQITFQLHAVDGGTDLHLTHERFPTFESRDSHGHGWTASLVKMLVLLAPAAGKRAEAMDQAVGGIGWNELVSTDAGSARSFYGDLFGWTSQPFPADPAYSILRIGAKPVGGLMQAPGSGVPSHWLHYVMVTDLDASIAKAVRLGGGVRVPSMTVPDVGRIAVLADPQGAVFGLCEPPSGQDG